MAGSIDPALTIDAIISVLTSGLGTALDALDTEYDDGITLDDIADYWRAPLEQYDAYPAVVVVADSNRKLWEAASGAFRTHRILLTVMIVGNEDIGGMLPQEIVTERLSRTMRGIEEVLRANDSLTVSGTNNAEELEVLNIDYGDFGVSAAGNAFARGATMTLDVRILDQ